MNCLWCVDLKDFRDEPVSSMPCLVGTLDHTGTLPNQALWLRFRSCQTLTRFLVHVPGRVCVAFCGFNRQISSDPTRAMSTFTSLEKHGRLKSFEDIGLTGLTLLASEEWRCKTPRALAEMLAVPTREFVISLLHRIEMNLDLS